MHGKITSTYTKFARHYDTFISLDAALACHKPLRINALIIGPGRSISDHDIFSTKSFQPYELIALFEKHTIPYTLTIMDNHSVVLDEFRKDRVTFDILMPSEFETISEKNYYEQFFRKYESKTPTSSAIRHITFAQPPLILEHADAFAVDFSKRNYDLVICTVVAFHYDMQGDALLNRIAKSVSPNGYFMTSDITPKLCLWKELYKNLNNLESSVYLLQNTRDRP